MQGLSECRKKNFGWKEFRHPTVPPDKKKLIRALVFAIFEILSFFLEFFEWFLAKKQQFGKISTRLTEPGIFRREGAVKKFFWPKRTLIYSDRSPLKFKNDLRHIHGDITDLILKCKNFWSHK